MTISAKDYSEIDRDNEDWKKIDFGKLDIPDREYATVTNNMGLYTHKGKKHTGGFCGWCWLKDRKGEIVTNDKSEPVVLHQKCRFEDGKNSEISAIKNMISVIAKDEEFISYINFDSSDPNKRLFTFFFDDPLIEGQKTDDDNKDDNKIVTAISYLALLKKLTRRGLMKKTVKRSENFTGKLRGHIDMKKQISKNLSAGRKERIYCTYIERSADITENRVIKYALNRAAHELGKYPELFKLYSGEFAICRRRLNDISDERFKPEDIDRIILPGMYKSYRPVLDLAKVILTEFSNVDNNPGSETVKIVPYAINMPLLFECYCRTRIKEALEKINNDQTDYRAELLPYVADKKNLNESDSKSGYATVGVKDCYIGGVIVPDIVIAYYQTSDENDSNKPFQYAVYDVKYKELHYKNTESEDNENTESEDNELVETNSRRNDRLQLLAYQSIYRCIDNIGHIFPRQYLHDTVFTQDDYDEIAYLCSDQERTLYVQMFFGGKMNEILFDLKESPFTISQDKAKVNNG